MVAVLLVIHCSFNQSIHSSITVTSLIELAFSYSVAKVVGLELTVVQITSKVI